MQQFSSLLSWHLFTAQHVSSVFPPIIRSSMTAVAASGFTFLSWWQSCCVCGRIWRIYKYDVKIHDLQKLNRSVQNMLPYMYTVIKNGTKRIWCDSHHMSHIIQKSTYTGLDRPCGFQDIEAPIISRQLMNMARLIALCIRRHTWFSLASAPLSTTVPWCTRKFYVNEKFKWLHWKSNPLPASTPINSAIACSHRDSNRRCNFHSASLSLRSVQEMSSCTAQTATLACCRYERTSQTTVIIVIIVPWRIYLSPMVH
jgi:hypothetical protein